MPKKKKMSNINLHNYEQYAIDYLEGSLSTSLQREMQLFLSAHPHIAQSFEGLENMKVKRNQQNAIPKHLLAALHSSAMLSMEMDEPNLIADKTIIFPHKAQLKKEQKKIALWWYLSSVAAAALLLLCLWKTPIQQTKRETLNIDHIDYIAIQALQPSEDMQKQTAMPMLRLALQTSIHANDIGNTDEKHVIANKKREKMIIASISTTYPKALSWHNQYENKWQDEIDMLFTYQERRTNLKPHNTIVHKRRSTFAAISRVLWRFTKAHSRQISEKILYDEDYAYQQDTFKK